jgi:hypothetical protein
VRAAATHAVLHHLPDARELRIDLCIGTPGALVAPHELRDRAGLAGAQREQLVAAVERMRQHRVVRDDLRAAVRVATDDEAAAHGVVAALEQQTAFRVLRGEAHAIGMQRQAFAAVEHQIAFLVEADRPSTEQVQPSGRAQRREPRSHRADVHAVRLVALEAEQHRLVAAVALAGGAQRSEQLDAQVRAALEQTVGLQAQCEQPRGPHRAHRVRAGRADADLEQVEGADGHAATLALG